ncbi:ATP-binding protein [Erythrobacter sp. NE805]|uniref:ATP-binding protein n=1 Tax=Erythrobacter sp. NE805 TaxID=3389875 RepID=UPI00396B14D3
MIDSRPANDAERFLRLVQRGERGRLTVYLGMAPGVGKTYRMLQEAARKRAEGKDVVVGIAETHGRSETALLVEPLEVLPRRSMAYEGHTLDEFDIDAALGRRPDLILVDELAHTNAPGSRHPKRWQDVAELLVSGIDVATTLNIQHIESLNDIVAGFTHVRVRETVPDSILSSAEIILVDLPPEALIERLTAGKVYMPETAGRALANFFTLPKLAALRELALRFAAGSVDRRLLDELDLSRAEGDFAVGERLLVAISAGKGGAQVVRHAKRLADLAHAPWTAVVVESGGARSIAGEQREQLAENLALASSLGASILTVAATDVAQALVDEARNLRATQIVIGKSRRSRWFEWRHGSVAQAVIRKARGIAVQVVPLDEADERPAAPRDANPWLAPLVALALVGASIAVLLLAEPWLAPGAIDMLLLLPVILTASTLRLQAGLWAALWAALGYNFCFTEPRFTLFIHSGADVITFAALALVAGVIGAFADKLRRQAETNAGVARLNASLARYAGLLASVSDRETTAEIACREIGALLGVTAVIVAEEEGALAVRGNPAVTRLDLVDEAAARWTLDKGEATGRDTGTLNASDWQFHPLRTSLGVMGALGLARGERGRIVRADDATLLASLLDQTALAHERLVLEEEARQVGALRERDRLRGALLGSIAHDLKTPLTAVIAAAEAIPDEGAYAEEVRIARSEARRLQRFLGDLLEASRIEDGALEPRMETVDLTDIVSAVLRDLRQGEDESRVVTRVDPACPLIPTDPVLLRHALINLIDNALKFSSASTLVEVILERDATHALCRVLDRGPGLPAEHAALFERFERLEGSDRVGGSGLGLWIAKNLVEALGGTIDAGNREGGGAVFTIALPLGSGAETGRDA